MKRKGQTCCPTTGCAAGGCGTSGCALASLRTGNPIISAMFARTSTNNSWILGKIIYYQRYGDPELKRRLHVKRICKFTPTCSEYSKAAIEKYGTVSGIMRTAWRPMRCNPLSKGGYDLL